MQILVLVKQVPAASTVKIDEETGVLMRDGVESQMNPYDLYALETAFQLKQSLGAKVVAMTMGPMQAKDVLLEAIYMGADDGVLVSGREFAGADVLATSYTLSQGIRAAEKRMGGFDLIICGKQTTDGDTAQVGPALSQTLKMAHVAWVSEIAAADEKGITVKQGLGDVVQTMELAYPCLITVEKGIFTPRLPSYKRKKASRGKDVLVLGFGDMPDQVTEHYGLKGSPTQVERIFPPPGRGGHIRLEGENLGDKIHAILTKEKLI